MRHRHPLGVGILALSLLATAHVATAAPATLTWERVQPILDDMTYGNHPPVMTVGKDGNIYGTSYSSVFRIDGAGTFSTIHDFAMTGDKAASRLVLGQDGQLYGFTEKSAFSANGPGNHGTFFRIGPAGYTALLALPTNLASDLVLGSDGAFYAASAAVDYGEGGYNVDGLVKLTTTGTYQALGGTAGGYAPVPILVGGDGALYGTGYYAHQYSVFRFDSLGNFTELVNFETPTNPTGAALPMGWTLGADGKIYGTTIVEAGANYGVVKRFDNLGNVEVLHTFTGPPDGSYAQPSLVRGADDAIYGVTWTGGAYALPGGTVFRVDTAANYSVVHSFSNTDGALPQQAPTLAKDGGLYGVTPGCGAYRVDSAGTTTYSLPGFSGDIHGPLVQGKDCALYGVEAQWAIYRIFEPGHLCQTIELAALPDRILGEPPFSVTATASSNLPVSFAASGSCTVDGNEVTLLDVGPCTLTASQVGDERFGPADEVSQVFTVPEPGQVESLLAGCALLVALARRREHMLA